MTNKNKEKIIDLDLEEELDKQFPKGDKSRGKALVLYVIAKTIIKEKEQALFLQRKENKRFIGIDYSKDYIKKERKELLSSLQEKIENVIKKIEDCSVFTYLDGTNERIMKFNPSEIVWNKEFKEEISKIFKEMEQ